VGFTQRQIASFHDEIYKMVKGGLSLFESLAHYCELKDIDVEVVAKLIDPVMLADLTQEANSNRMLRPSKRSQKIDFD